MPKRTIENIDVTGKRVLLRVDFNVPMTRDGVISDDSRIRATLPTFRYLINHRSRIIACSHLGRPKGRVIETLRMAPVAKMLSELLKRPVTSLTDCVGPAVEEAVAEMQEGDVILLENLRFHAEEEANDPGFSTALSHLGDIYVNDAFGASHRSHASVTGVVSHLPAVSGFLMEKEIEMLGGLLENPGRPFAAVIGGAKVSGKIGLLEKILLKVDTLIIGGGMAATFFKSMGYCVGTSPVEDDNLPYVHDLFLKAKSSGVTLLLPPDVVITKNLDNSNEIQVVPVTRIPEGWAIADIGPEAIHEFSRELKRCRTVFWNGPMGVFEVPGFSEGTNKLAMILADLDAVTVIGGGSTAEVVTELKLAGKMSHVSTGGGASLQFLSGKELPGVAVLPDLKREGKKVT
jgi:phosphoglycerate kinase